MRNNLLWCIPAVLMLVSLCLQIAAQSDPIPERHLIVARHVPTTSVE
jgi:hypothetical protein